MDHMPEEGVTKFELDYTWSPPDPALEIHALSSARQQLWQLGLIGQATDRYGGVGYGNVSHRINLGENRFLVSGSQTGAIEWLGPEHYAQVTAFDTAQNRVTATGPARPSSESLTHGMLYELDSAIRVILHVHSPEIWMSAASTGLATTDPDVAYGTPAMALEVARLFRETDVRARGMFVMGGHRDGVIVFGTEEQAAVRVLLDSYAQDRQTVTG